jgi:acyl-CoA thioester hydrolase
MHGHPPGAFPADVSFGMPAQSVDIQVRFADTDALGHVNNASFATWAEVARLRVFAELGELVRTWILASLHIDYRRQVDFTDHVRVETSIERIGTTSITVAQTVFANDERAADVKSVIVQFDYATSKPLPLSRALRAVLERFVAPSEKPAT